MRDRIRRQKDAAERDAWFRREVQIGLDAAAAGDLIPAEEVEAEAMAWRAEIRRKLTDPALRSKE
jgi:predicted transcriptional regulator